jgi:dinuclear metal center YbgI/SA1388 family protein
MAVSCQTVINLVEKSAPKMMAEEWDNVGLQIGDPAQSVSCIFLSLDLNEEIFQEALAAGADMLLVHHTPFFKPLKNIRTDLPGGKLIAGIIKQEMALYTAHTNLDAADGGVNDTIAAKLNLQKVKILAESWQERLYKLVVFVPRDYTEKVSEAICRAGGGWIGNYSDCTFRVEGTGTFLPLDGQIPLSGSKESWKRPQRHGWRQLFRIKS